MAVYSIFTSTTWWIWTLWLSRPKCPPPPISTRPSAQGMCVNVRIWLSLWPWQPYKKNLTMTFFPPGSSWSQTLSSAVSTPATRDEKHPIQLIATSLIKSGKEVMFMVDVVCTGLQLAELTYKLFLGSFPLAIMWRSWAIPTCGFRISEDFIFLVMLRRCVCANLKYTACVTTV